MARDNYRIVRESLTLGHWDEVLNQWVPEPPTNAEILNLLDALHADREDSSTGKADEIRSSHYWNS